MFEAIQALAGGDINPSRFVKLSTAADYTLLEADANEQTVGASTDATRDAPVPNASTLAAASGEPVHVKTIGSICLVTVGSGGVTRGALVKSDADGKAVLAATTGTTVQWVSGRALATCAEGELAPILLESYPYRPALA